MKRTGDRKLQKLWVALLTSVALVGCASGAIDSSTIGDSPSSPFNEYRIGPADVLSIYVREQAEMTRTVTVRPDGVISMPLLGDLSVSGLTPLQLRDILVNGLRRYVQVLPEEITVGVEEIHSYAVSVLGEVRLPGRFEFQGPVTVLDVIAQAGGMTEFAASSRITILRQNASGERQRIRFNYADVLSPRLDASQLNIFPGDIVVVP